MVCCGMQPDQIREEIRQAIVTGADSHRITERTVAWCKANVTPNAVRLAAVAQIVQILKLSQSQAGALVSEFLV